MKINIPILYLLLCFAIPMSAEVGDTIIHKGVQYKITAPNEVSAIHYDSAFITIPDSVTYGTQKYAVTSVIEWYNPKNCSLQHYDKIDLSAAINITSLASQQSGLIAVDTLILPPNIQKFPVFYTTDSLDGNRLMDNTKLLPGIHRVYSTGKQDLNIGIGHCSSLLEADLSSYTTTFSYGSDWRFYDNPFLQKLIIPKTIKIFGHYMFNMDIRLSELSIPDSLEMIWSNAFNSIAMDTLKLGAKVYEVSPLIGPLYEHLRWIEVGPANPFYVSENGVLYTKEKSSLVVYPYSRDGQEYALAPNTKSIAYNAFAHGHGSEYETLDMDIWQQRMNEGKLKKIIFNNSLQELQHSTFCGSCIKDFQGFENTQVQKIANDCFRFSAVESIYFPENLREIGDRAFAETPNLRKLGAAVSQSIHTIGQEAFRDAWNLEEIDLFGCNALVEIPKSMCLCDSSLTYVGLPRNVQTIGDRAFEGCISLEKILCPAVDPIPVNPSVFAGVPKWKCVLSVPAGSVEKYKKANVWKDFYYIEAAPLYYIATDVTDTLTGWVMGGGLYQKGENATVVANPYEGYQFSTWSDGITTNPRLIHVTKDMSLVAEFVKSTEAVETPASPASTNGKRIENGQVVIIRDDKTYNTLGTEIK